METVKYEEEMGDEEFNRYIKEYGHVYKKFNIPFERVKKSEFEYTDYKYVFRIPIERNMEIENYKVYKDSIVIRLRKKKVKKRARQNTLLEYIEN